jgi:signal transduction histidine kinase
MKKFSTGGLPGVLTQAVGLHIKTGSSLKAGTGLGLSIVQAIARAHGGDSGVVNRPGQGATFWIRIPWQAS